MGSGIAEYNVELFYEPVNMPMYSVTFYGVFIFTVILQYPTIN